MDKREQGTWGPRRRTGKLTGCKLLYCTLNFLTASGAVNLLRLSIKRSGSLDLLDCGHHQVLLDGRGAKPRVTLRILPNFGLLLSMPWRPAEIKKRKKKKKIFYWVVLRFS